MTDTDPSATLSAIRERGYRNGATGAECARLSDAAAVDIPVLVAALEAALKLADEWKTFAAPGDAQDECADELREAITAALAGKESGRG